MQDTSESSIWRSLAVAFGDGLAFGVGMKLSQHTAKTGSAAPPSDLRLLANRLGQLEEHINRLERVPAPSASLDQKVLEAIVNAVEARLQEYSGQMERRLADMEARIAVELKSLDQQDKSVAKRLAQDLATLEGQMLSLNRGLSDAMNRIVSDQVASLVAARTPLLDTLDRHIAEQVTARTAPLESLDERIAAQVKSQMAPFDTLEERVAQQLATRTAPLDTLDERIATQVKLQVAAERIEFEEKAGAGVRSAIAAAVSARVEPAERSLRDLLAGMARMCQQAAELMDSPSAAPGNDTEDPPPPAAASEDSEENPVPGFAQPQKPGRLWRVPLVSSLVVAAGGLILMHLR